MMKRFGMAVLCATLVACGGSDSAGSNSAAGKAFTYGDPDPYTDSGATAVTSELVAVVNGSTSSPMALTSVNATTVLGSDGYTSMPTSLTADARATALRAAASPRAISAEFDNAVTCYKETDTSATFTNCTITMNGTDYQSKVTVNGSASLTKTSEDSGELKWDLDVAASYAGNGTSMSLVYGFNGDLKGSSTHIAGTVLSSIAFDATSGGQSTKVGLDESLSINLNLADTCSSSVIEGSTLEAKRVWTAHPSSGTWHDQAAKITWTGCGAATIQVSSS